MEDRTITIKTKIEGSYFVVGEATRGFVKQTVYWLGRFGKRVSRQFVESQGKRQDVKRANFYEAFLTWITALFYANYAGFELLWTDLQIFVSDLQRRKLKNLSHKDFTTPGFPARREIFFELSRMQSSLNALKGELGLEVMG